MQDNSKYSLDSSKLKYTILNILVLFIIGLFFVYRMKPSVSKMSTIKMPEVYQKCLILNNNNRLYIMSNQNAIATPPASASANPQELIDSISVFSNKKIN